MPRLKDLARGFDRRWAGGSIAMLSLVIATTLAPPATSVPVSDPALDEIRGTNPDFFKQSQGSCTTENVRNLNLFDPPGGPPTAVAYNNCLYGLNGVSMCISCVLNRIVYQLNEGSGPAPGIDIDRPKAVDCGADRGGIKGICRLNSAGEPYCGSQSGYSCNTYGIDYEKQGAGGGG